MNNNSFLQLSEKQMRDLGYGVVDVLIEHQKTLAEKTPTRRSGRQAMERIFREVLPQKPNDPMEVLKRAKKDIFGNIMHLDHPRFFAFIPSPGNFVSVMADALAIGFNVFAGTWLEAAGPSEIELLTIDWLRTACGFPSGAGGLFTSGGSAANLTAVATARHIELKGNMERAVAYCSDQTHSSVDRAFRILGFGPGQLRKLQSDQNFRLDVQALRDAVSQDRSAGLKPFFVVANSGTTNTGAIDPLPELAAFCRDEDLWLHVDGAYGAAAAFCERGRKLLEGIGSADSLTIDPHKWLFQPYEIGCLIVRDRSHLREAFHILPEYLIDVAAAEEEINFSDYGPQLTRYFRALKLWMSLQVFGAEAFAGAIERGFELAETAESVLREMEDWRLVTPAQMGIITFQAQPKGFDEEEQDRHNRALVEAILDDGYAMVVSTRLNNRIVLRMCPINPRTSEQDIRETLHRLDRLSRKLQQRKGQDSS